MNTKMLKRVRQMYNVEYMSASTNRHNQRQWIKSIRNLGDKWLLAEYVGRKENAR